MEVTITVNGTAETLDIEPRLLLVHVLRENLRLTGTQRARHPTVPVVAHAPYP